MEVFWVVMFFVAVAAYAVISTIVHGKKRKRLLENGKIVARAGDYYKYVYYFTTNIGDFSTIYSAINHSTLRELRVRAKPDAQRARAVFQISRKVFVAALQQEGALSEGYLYSFGFLRWKESYGAMEGTESANALLTAIERAFMQLDPNMDMKSARAEFKERFF